MFCAGLLNYQKQSFYWMHKMYNCIICTLRIFEACVLLTRSQNSVIAPIPTRLTYTGPLNGLRSNISMTMTSYGYPMVHHDIDVSIKTSPDFSQSELNDPFPKAYLHFYDHHGPERCQSFQPTFVLSVFSVANLFLFFCLF